ncbi:BglII/BstYI family type II restriction endonuclease [Actinomyces sp.]|uniref:BglII/BstYI family type II restriction endonuclease n=1 Tax=Actinomyces sp. TaxID=29317 RepID=UPI0026DC3619|nr:BglII/BstYI family type II restriction endonuclease [Actinomyces sp.]MDO4901870.1 BglII/BstYI family type II restriction endonuclease [Actinomyces sp.]
MELTRSFETALPNEVRSRYEIRETRNAAVIFRATNPDLFNELVEALNRFEILSEDLLSAGGQESSLARRFNDGFRSRGWREARVDTDIILKLTIMPYKPAGEKSPKEKLTPASNKGYKVDNFKGRIALDLEWNAKDGNLDRDISAYRALYDAGFIDVGVIVTRTQEDLRTFATGLRLDHGMPETEAKKMLATTTTTNLEKLIPRLTRGDAAGCPILAIAISSRTFENSPTRTHQ